MKIHFNKNSTPANSVDFLPPAGSGKKNRSSQATERDFSDKKIPHD